MNDHSYKGLLEDRDVQLEKVIALVDFICKRMTRWTFTRAKKATLGQPFLPSV